MSFSSSGSSMFCLVSEEHSVSMTKRMDTGSHVYGKLSGRKRKSKSFAPFEVGGFRSKVRLASC